VSSSLKAVHASTSIRISSEIDLRQPTGDVRCERGRRGRPVGARQPADVQLSVLDVDRYVAGSERAIERVDALVKIAGELLEGAHRPMRATRASAVKRRDARTTRQARSDSDQRADSAAIRRPTPHRTATPCGAPRAGTAPSADGRGVRRA
jgi:hypothetical protein